MYVIAPNEHGLRGATQAQRMLVRAGSSRQWSMGANGRLLLAVPRRRRHVVLILRGAEPRYRLDKFLSNPRRQGITRPPVESFGRLVKTLDYLDSQWVRERASIIDLSLPNGFDRRETRFFCRVVLVPRSLVQA
jgi:hypothetical protein